MPRDAQLERSGLCDDALAAGLEAPTRCEGWTVRDLLVHLVVRDGRPDVALGAALGRVVPSLRERSERVEAALRALPDAELVERVRSGPPAGSPVRLGPLDDLVNRAEFFVHREDVRRGRPGWEPRELPRALSRRLWRLVAATGRVWYRRAGTGVVLVTPDGPRAVVRRGPLAVSLTGEPQELLLHAMGRRDVARVEVAGTAGAVARFAQAYPS